MADQLTQAVRKALDAAPGSLRSVARAAGLSHTLLRMIRDGERSATPAVAKAVAKALEQWEKNCGQAAARLRRVTKERGKRR